MNFSQIGGERITKVNKNRVQWLYISQTASWENILTPSVEYDFAGENPEPERLCMYKLWN